MSNPKVEVYKTLYDMTNKATVKAAGEVPADNRYRQVQEAKAHPLWLLGHLANTQNLVVNMWCLGGAPELPREWGKMFSPDFAQGDPVSPDPSKYPDWDTVVGEYTKIAASTQRLIGEWTDADIEGDYKGKVPDPFRQHFGSVADCLLSLSGHDSHHRGQIMLLAKLS